MAKNLSIDKVCSQCGEKFKTNRNDIRYCSDECRYKAKLIRNSERREFNLRSISEIVRTCVYCKKDYISNNNSQMYCSDKCKRTVNNERASNRIKNCTRSCKICGKEFKPKRSLFNFCSIQCKEKSNLNKYGNNLFGRKTILKTKCPMCGKIYNRLFLSGWIGNGMPRMNCISCERYIQNKPSIIEHYSMCI